MVNVILVNTRLMFSLAWLPQSTFNRELKRAGYNLDEWRRKCRYDEEDFDLLDADGICS